MWIATNIYLKFICQQCTWYHRKHTLSGPKHSSHPFALSLTKWRNSLGIGMPLRVVSKHWNMHQEYACTLKSCGESLMPSYPTLLRVATLLQMLENTTKILKWHHPTQILKCTCLYYNDYCLARVTPIYALHPS